MNVSKWISDLTKKSYVVERFTNAKDLLEHIRQPRIKRYNASEKYASDDFTDNMSYVMAESALIHGIERGMDSFKQTMNARRSNTTKITCRDDVVGFAPIVPMYLMGLPKDMLCDFRRTVKSKVVDLYIDSRVSGGASASKYEKCGNKILSAIIELEQQGYRVRVNVVKIAIIGSKCDIMVLPIKNEYQPLDLRRFTFPLLSVAFNRRIAWKWNETSTNVQINDSGYSSYFDLNDNNVKDLRHLFGEGAVFLRVEDAMHISDFDKWVIEQVER